MFYKYEIKNNGKENILYLYLNMAYEFSKELALDINHNEVARRTNNFIKSNNIDFNGDKVYLVIDGIVVKTLDISNIKEGTNDIKSDFIYSNDKFLVTLKLDGTSFIEITLRDYLLGCLANSMIHNMELETLKAMCVLYRTYAYKMMEDDHYISFDNDFIQYRPISYYKMVWIDNYNLRLSKLEEAINETDCMFACYENKYILPFIHLCNSGRTFYHPDYKYLKNIKSLWDLGSPYYIDIRDYSYEHFNRIFNLNNCDKYSITINELDYKGFVKKITINDNIYNGEEFRKLLNLNSLNLSIIINKNYIRIITRGFGNSLGLSIYGANELALNDCNFINILSYYFNGIVINKYKKEKELY